MSQVAIMSDTEQDRKLYLTQIQSLKELMMKPGWAFLQANWHARREQILHELEKSGSESKWQFQKGQLVGFREAVGMIHQLLEDYKNMQADEEMEESYGG